MTRIVFGCFEVPGWGGLTTSAYRLFATMLEDGLDVHYVNLILEQDLARFQEKFGPGFENPRGLPNVHSCHLRAALHEDHPALTTLIDKLAPDRMVGVGDISGYLMKRASPQRQLVFLTAGSMQVKRTSPVLEQLAAMDTTRPETPDWKERETVAMSELILTHSPLTRELYRRFYPDHARRIHPEVFWFAEWIGRDAAEHAGLALPFDERDIDALFIASSWTRQEKNVGLTTDIVARLDGLSAHIVGEFADPIASATHHGFVGTRAELFRLMGRARSVVCPSLFDAAPGILFEGSVMGCNVIASRNCGNWELCNEALLVDDYTADGFEAAIRIARTKRFPDHMETFLEPSSYRMLTELLTG